MNILSDCLAFVGFVLALPGLILIAIADRIDEHVRLRALTKEFG